MRKSPVPDSRSPSNSPPLSPLENLRSVLRNASEERDESIHIKSSKSERDGLNKSINKSINKSMKSSVENNSGPFSSSRHRMDDNNKNSLARPHTLDQRAASKSIRICEPGESVGHAGQGQD